MTPMGVAVSVACPWQLDQVSDRDVGEFGIEAAMRVAYLGPGQASRFAQRPSPPSRVRLQLVKSLLRRLEYVLRHSRKRGSYIQRSPVPPTSH